MVCDILVNEIFRGPDKNTLTEVEQKIYTYLKHQIKKGKSYFKSKYISIDIEGTTSKQVGQSLLLMSKMKNLDLKIVMYSKNGSRWTWKVEKCLYANNKSVS